ncbi:peptidoglycan/xylan/chitin deacetylase (PgdA/CDA1 family) [Paenibacillus jamilae]|nr:peptidoglycan/xylan/chitin deacetylase (PgdA/CDA1 family) [Paenibacillus jamilae]
MDLPWRSNTSQNTASQSNPRYETPLGAQTKANKAEDKANDYTTEKFNGLKKTLDQAIIQGDSGPEATTARYSTPYDETYPILKDRLDANDTRVIAASNNLKTVNVQVAKTIVPDNYTGAVVTFVDDDGYTQFLSRWKPIAEAKGFKMDTAVNSAYLGQTDSKGIHMTLNQLKDLHDEGFGVISHTNTHGDFNNYTPAQLDAELKASLEWIVSNGFGEAENILVYPYGVTSDKVDIKNAVRKYFNYAISVNNDVNPMIVDNMCVNRVHGDLRDLQGLKDALDYSISQKSWLVVLTHSWDDQYWDAGKFNQFVDYINSKGVPILKANDAIKLKGNALAVGEYTDQINRSIFLSRSGVNNIGIKVVGDAFTYTTNTPITSFDPAKITVVPLFTTQDLFLGVGGTMEVHRVPPNDDFSYAIYKPATRNELYLNKWNTVNNTWNGWVRIATPTSHIVNNNVSVIVMDDPITAYDKDVETIIPVVSTKDTFLGVGGVMKVFRSSLQNFSYATYTPYNVNALYMRKWVENSSTWGTWGKISP